jgi:hypothetical protein
VHALPTGAWPPLPPEVLVLLLVLGPLVAEPPPCPS